MNQQAPSLRPWVLAETNYGLLRDRRVEVAVWPFGAVEPHNLHLPYGTDCLEAQIIGEKICERAYQQGATVLLLPVMPFGTETNLQAFPFALNVSPSTLLAVIRDVVESLERSGVRKLLLLNSHGGNDLKPVLRELYGRTSVWIFLCNWYQAVRQEASSLFEHPDDHAGEMETSFALAFFPHLIARDVSGKLLADDGKTARFRFRALEDGWVTITRPWHLLTTQSGAGNPHCATAEKGQALMRILVERLSEFLIELAQSPLDERFPFV